MANGVWVNGVVGVFAGRFGQLLKNSSGFVVVFRYLSALIFFALAVRMAIVRL